MTLDTVHLGSGSWANKVETDRRLLSRLFGGRRGVITGFTASTPAGMNLGLTAGEAIVGGKSAPTTQGAYYVTDTAAATLAWPAAAASPRIDALVLMVGDSQYGAQGNLGPRWLIVQGTPAGSPSPPTDAQIQTAVGPGGWERALEVLVPVGAATLLPGNITVKWTNAQSAPLLRIGRYNTVQAIGAAVETSVQYDTVVENIGFTVPALPSATITIPKDGVYLITGKGSLSPIAAGALFHVGLHLPSGSLDLHRSSAGGASNPMVVQGNVTERFTAGQTLDLFLYTTNATSTYNSRTYGTEITLEWRRD